MNKILLLGNTGQVGWELNRTLLSLGELIALDYPQVNMTDPASIRALVNETQPTLIINATAYTDVDRAEIEPDLARAINSTGVKILAEEAQNIHATLIHYSTDYVFDGAKGAPYVETDTPNPLNVYGETKLGGERALESIGAPYLIFRTSWVYSDRRPCFVTKVRQWARQHETLRIVDDQVSSPTWARTLAEITAQIVAQGKGDLAGYLADKSGIYHLAGGGYCSRYEWAQAILDTDPHPEQQVVKKVLPAKSIDFPTPAFRPLISILDCKKIVNTFQLELPDWKLCQSLISQT